MARADLEADEEERKAWWVAEYKTWATKKLKNVMEDMTLQTEWMRLELHKRQEDEKVEEIYKKANNIYKDLANSTKKLHKRQDDEEKEEKKPRTPRCPLWGQDTLEMPCWRIGRCTDDCANYEPEE